MGAARTFSGVDIYGRLKRMQGLDVFEPIGLDGFGIHSENYALKINKHPFDHAKDSEKNFYRQLSELGNGFAWEERLETYDPAYYKWTQWIFTQMFKNGLAYRKKAPVNWCPSCKTVLADEQVLQGECERCETKVIKKELEQWFFKITDYAERLLKNLDTLDWPEKIKIAQRNWIGRSEGAEIEFRIKNHESRIKVFTTRPDTLFGATFLVVGPEHPFVMNYELGVMNDGEVKKYVEKSKNKTIEERFSEGKEKTGVELKGIKVINPANGEEIPIWVADYVLGNVGTGAIMAVPAHDERDREFAKKFNLPISNAPLVDKDEVIKKIGGKKTIQYRLRDWLISRQRYWGPPIPMIYCEKCNWQPVPEKDLPVKLPYVKDFRPTGTEQSPLVAIEKFWKVKCPQCGSAARRETDVSDSFLDSSWYYIGYLGFDKTLIKKWLPVHSYIGGAEHAVLHLLYSRFVAMALHDMSVLHFEEPFTRFRAHGLITKDGAKMSKSRGNVVSPDAYIEKYGADAVRMYLAFLAPFEEGGDFRDSGIKGITRFLDRVEKFVKNQKSQIPASPLKIQKILHRTIKKVTEDIETLHYNTAISALMVLLNAFEEYREEVDKKSIKIFLKLLAPFAPFLTEELWREKWGNKKSIHLAPWPAFDPQLLEEETYQLVMEINGRMRVTIKAPRGINQEEVERLARDNDHIKSYLENKMVRKIIFVPNRLINFVV